LLTSWAATVPQRLTNYTGTAFNPYTYLTGAWLQTDNIMHVDFELYNTYVDALSGRNPWRYCNYGTGAGFPTDCGQSGSVGSQHSRFDTKTGQNDVALFIEQMPIATHVNGVPVVHRASPATGGAADCIGCLGQAHTLGLKGSSFTVSAWLAVPTWRVATAQGNNDAVGAPAIWLSLLSSTIDKTSSRLFIGLDEQNRPTMSFGTNREPCRASAESALLSMTWSHVVWRYYIADQAM
jgi:hypothetical protein